MSKAKVLFICTHNSARSQISEAYLRQFASDRFEVESAGFEPTSINPLAIDVMKEVGIDISGKKTQSVFELYRQARLYDYVITVCDKGAEEKCPVFPGITRRLDWRFDDPAAFVGTREEKLARTRQVRDQIREAIQKWLNDLQDKQSN